MKEIPLYKNKAIVGCAKVDDEDFEWLSKNQWYFNVEGYAVRMVGSRENKKYVWMHRAILSYYGEDFSDDKVTHHINHDKTDNQKENIEAVSRTKNQQSRHRKRDGCASQYKGVSYYPKNNLWRASIDCESETVYCRYFESEVDAAFAYNHYAKLYHKEYALLNELPWDYIENPEILKVRGKGTSLRPSGSWEAAIFDSNGKYIYLGRYNTEIEAEIAYNIAAKELLGDKATLNDIPEEYSGIIPMRTTRGNTSKYKNIHFNSTRDRWIAHVKINGKLKYVGGFKTEEEAVNAQSAAMEVCA